MTSDSRALCKSCGIYDIKPDGRCPGCNRTEIKCSCTVSIDSTYYSGGSGNDIMNGDDGNDRMNGNSGDDQIIGGNGDDELTGEEGADAFNCGAGTDTITDFNAAEGDTKTADSENF